MQKQLFAPFTLWLHDLDLEIQWRKKVTLYDICDSDDRIVELYKQHKTATEAAKELINEVSGGTN